MDTFGEDLDCALKQACLVVLQGFTHFNARAPLPMCKSYPQHRAPSLHSGMSAAKGDLIGLKKDKPDCRFLSLILER